MNVVDVSAVGMHVAHTAYLPDGSNVRHPHYKQNFSALYLLYGLSLACTQRALTAGTFRDAQNHLPAQRAAEHPRRCGFAATYSRCLRLT